MNEHGYLKTTIIYLFFPIAWFIFEWAIGTHTVYFQLRNDYQMTLTADTRQSFLDYPIEFTLRVHNKNNGRVSKYKLFTGEGPEIRFMAHKKKTNMLFIEGYNDNSNARWELNLEKEEISLFVPPDSTIRAVYYPIYEISEDFKLVRLNLETAKHNKNFNSK
jgi:hypothetical protein